MNYQPAYREEGKGQVLLLLHGYCESKDIWKPVMASLGEQARLLAPDLPGFGENPAAERATSMDDMADSLRYWLRDKDIVRIRVAGHSMGGYVALALAEKYPEMVDGLCLFHSTAKADSSEKKKKRDQTRDFIQEKGVVAFVKNFIPGLFAEAGRKNMQNSIADVIQLAARTPQPTATAAMNAMRDRPDRQHVIRDASFPVMLVAGEQDLVVPVNDLEIQADLTNLAALRVIRNCGHMGMFENPKESIRVLQDFMAM